MTKSRVSSNHTLVPLMAILLTAVLAMPAEAAEMLAYVGPGAGLSAIGALLALVFAVVVAIIGFVWYPVRRILKGRRRKPEGEGGDE